MLAIIVGILFIVGGTGWFLLVFFAAGMASRQVTTWESIGRPALALIPIVLGIAIMIWG